MELSKDIGHRPIVLIRFNPDAYRINGIKHSSCWSYKENGKCVVDKSQLKNWNIRLKKLAETINYWTDGNNITDKTVELVKLYYNK
jgi:hypothetical protein